MRSERRSTKRITNRDLARLAEVARQDRAAFFSRPRPSGPLPKDVLCVTLCQGAALHFVDGQNGIKDFDVWTFYRRRRNLQFPPRRVVSRDFGHPKFGQSFDRPEFVGRRVDLIGRSLDLARGESPAAAVQRYLTEGSTESARRLSEKAVVMLEPTRFRGLVVWPM